MSGVVEARLRRYSHWSAKLFTRARERGSASMRRTCCSSTAGVFELSRDRRVQQFVVRNAAPQEERQARRQFQIADAISRVRRDARRDPAPRGTGTPDSPAPRADAISMPASKSALRACLLIELQRHLQIRIGHRTPVGPAHQRGQESAWRTRLPRPALAGRAHENPAAAGRVARALSHRTDR